MTGSDSAAAIGAPQNPVLTALECVRWPESPSEATADRLIVYFAYCAESDHAVGAAWMHASDVASDEEDHAARIRRWVDHAALSVSAASLAWLLVRAQADDRAGADRLAGELWARIEHGGALSEMSWEWLADRGMDAAHLSQIAAASAEERVQRDLGEH